MRIFLVRHGETKWNVEKRIQGNKRVPLNSKGKAQARKAGKRFKKVKLTAIYSSPFVRAMQTAREIAKYHKIKIIPNFRFAERKFGKLQGLTYKQLIKKIPDINEQWKRDGIDWRPSGGETLRELQIRAKDALKDIVKKHKPGDTILIVTHGGLIKSIVHHLNGGKMKGYLTCANPENAGVAEIVYAKKRFSLK